MIDGKDKARIEAAIRVLSVPVPRKPGAASLTFVYDREDAARKKAADLCRYFLTGEKEQDTWTDKDFGLVPTKEGLEEEDNEK